MTDGMFCAKCLSQYQEILSKTRLFGTGKYSKLGITLYMYIKASTYILKIELLLMIQPALDISNYRYLKVNFLVPEN